MSLSRDVVPVERRITKDSATEDASLPRPDVATPDILGEMCPARPSSCRGRLALTPQNDEDGFLRVKGKITGFNYDNCGL